MFGTLVAVIVGWFLLSVIAAFIFGVSARARNRWVGARRSAAEQRTAT